MRRTFVVMCLPVALLALSACSSSSKSGTTFTTTTATTPSGGTPSGGVSVSTNPVPPITIDAYILSVDPKAHVITVDPMAFLTGATATDAFKHDHPDAAEGPPNDYYISNPKKDNVALQLAPTVTVRLVHVGGTDHTQPVAVPLSSMVGYPSLARRPFRLTATNGTVSSITEIFVP